ncbi:AraC family transcriptional regulator [Saccharopolyspora indica]|uniref:helix-turn-helix domain-containing protein n=1 Tax=Saccharopolyspora indica TaxID=1229659 RepID=UPI0022EA709F|nr:AraC family transcriptional regulator [Saccharopolyspora indica]MDA3647004.1 AraC family transcriptional regulator [Saccharopolyspora indica]
MSVAIAEAVGRAIDRMRRDLAEPVTVDELASSAMFSKYHFTRVFRQHTGLSPARFLSALRIAAAKELLRSSSATVVDISHQVGYNSVGTFSARFHRSVGMPPSAYRRNEEITGAAQRIARRNTPPVLRGNISPHARKLRQPVFIGLFPGRIMEGAPARSVVLDCAGPYQFDDLPAGTWHLLAHSLPVAGHPVAGQSLVGGAGPVTIKRGVSAGIADLRLRPRCAFDPPMLSALPEQCLASFEPRVAHRAG